MKTPLTSLLFLRSATSLPLLVDQLLPFIISCQKANVIIIFLNIIVHVSLSLTSTNVIKNLNV